MSQTRGFSLAAACGALLVLGPGGMAMDLYREADTFLTPVNMDAGDRLHFTLADGAVRQVELAGSGIDVYEDFGSKQWTLWADVNVDGHRLHLVYSPFHIKAFFEPKVVNGVRIGLDAVKGLAAATGFSDNGKLAARPPKAVRLWVNDATLPLIPNCHPWFDLFGERPWMAPGSPPASYTWAQWPCVPDYRVRQDRDVHVSASNLSTNQKTGYLGAWTYGLHVGLDIQLPKSNALYAVTDGAEVVSGEPTYGVWPEGGSWSCKLTRPNGDTWQFGNVHCDALQIPVGTPVRAGDVYALSGNKEAGMPHAHTSLYHRDASDGTLYALNPWIAMWQGIENRKEQDGCIRARIGTLSPATTNEPVAFSSAGSHPGGGFDTLACRWFFSDGTRSTHPAPTRTFSSPGLHQAILVVNDGFLQDMDEVFFTVGTSGGAAMPRLDLEVYALPALPRVGQGVTFAVQATGADGHGLDYLWVFDDGVELAGRAVTHAFAAPGRHAVVVIVTDVVTGRKRMDGCLLDTWEWPLPVRPGDIVLDSESGQGVSIQGDWQSYSNWSGFVGRGILRDRNAGKGEKRVRFAPNLPQAGRYEVFLSWATHPTNAASVPVTVGHAEGEAAARVDMRRDGGQWNSLGVYPFEAGTNGFVLLENRGTLGMVVADAVRLVRSSRPAAYVKVARDALWRYRKGTAEASAPAEAWRAPGYDDGDWASGPAPFGYGDAGTVYGTVLGDMKDLYSSALLRTAFSVVDPAAVAAVRFTVRHDDGFILWLNGAEIARVNVAGPAGAPVPCDSLAVSNLSATWTAVLTGASLPALERGTNVLAAQALNRALSSGDLVLDLEMRFEEAPAAGDTDANGLPDSWELERLGAAGSAGAADADGDGMSNLEEYITGSSPTDPVSWLALDVRLSGGTAVVVLPTVAASGPGYEGLSRHYALEQRACVVEPWNPVPGHQDIPGAGQTVLYSPPHDAGAGWFRARVWLEDP